MDKTRSYIVKGERPLFVDLDLPGVEALDRVDPARQERLVRFAREGGGAVAPCGVRSGIAELVGLARDEEQGFYRVLRLEASGEVKACLGFGLVSGCQASYDCFGVVAADWDWMGRAFDALVEWLGKAQARLARMELDTASADALSQLASRGFVVEGRLKDFYADGTDQLLLVWRPGREKA
jgi:hypothetical protein